MPKTKYQGVPRPAARAVHFPPHALERCLERAQCAPSWLEDVLKAGQFAHLRQLQYRNRRAVLVFDALQDRHIVVVIGPTSVRAVTVLTTAQYENAYGLIPAILLSLAKQARLQGLVAPDATELTHQAYPLATDWSDRESRKRAERWRASWFCLADLSAVAGRPSTMRRRITPDVKQHGLVDAYVARTPCAVDDAVTAISYELFPSQACLLIESCRFQRWLVEFLESQGLDLAHLVNLRLEASYHPHADVNVTEALVQALQQPSP